jgi:putative transposase
VQRQPRNLASILLLLSPMARHPRSLTVLPNFSVHKIWRGHNRDKNIGTDEEKQKYLKFFNDDFESEKYVQGAELMALTLMDNHTHEIYHVTDQPLFSEHMRRHHTRYGIHFNRMHERSGKVAEDRPKTCLLETEYQQMVVTFYVHANPVRAKMVSDAKKYLWTTHSLYAFGKRLPWMRNIVLPPWYLKLGRTAALRQKKYRQLFDAYLKREGMRPQPQFQHHCFGSVLWMHDRHVIIKNWHRKRRRPP